ncbi:MAG: phosphohistidine phosphatase SixA [Anaerolineales bacterium]|jgi:phosphohistidine phosphatase
MNLFLLRHAIAVDRGLPGYEDDSQRPLTPKGAAKMRRIAKGLIRVDPKIDLILTSSYLRAVQTAQIVAAVYGMDKRLQTTDALTPMQSPAAVIREIVDMLPGPSNLLLVGHEPFLSSLTSVLLAGDESLAIIFRKGGVCKLSVQELKYGRCATLEWLATPKLLSRLG